MLSARQRSKTGRLPVTWEGALIAGFADPYIATLVERAALQANPDPVYTLSVVMYENPQSKNIIVRSLSPGQQEPVDTEIGLSWPKDVYSLAHVALPFPPHDALYGGHPQVKSPGIQLGAIALRGERGVLQIPAADMLRLLWNPFYPYVESRVLEFLGLDGH